MAEMTPLPYANEFLEDTKINLHIPYVDQWELGVNTRALNHITKIANINLLNINGSNNGEIEQIAAVISSVNADGSTSAKGAKLNRVPKFKTDFDHDPQLRPIAFRYINANLDINMNEISRVAAESSLGVRSPQVWVRQLNPVLKKGTNEIITNHLLKGVDNFDLIGLAFTTVYPVASMAIRGISAERVTSMFVSQIALAALLAGIHSFVESKNRFYCVDVFGPYAPQLLRALYLNAYIKSRPLITLTNTK